MFGATPRLPLQTPHCFRTTEPPVHALIFYTLEEKTPAAANVFPPSKLCPRSSTNSKVMCVPPPLSSHPVCLPQPQEKKRKWGRKGGRRMQALQKLTLSHRPLVISQYRLLGVWWGTYFWGWEDRGGTALSSELPPSFVIEYFIRGTQTTQPQTFLKSLSILLFFLSDPSLWVWGHSFLFYVNIKCSNVSFLQHTYYVVVSIQLIHSGWTLMKSNILLNRVVDVYPSCLAAKEN